jgi:hypothetical protein
MVVVAGWQYPGCHTCVKSTLIWLNSEPVMKLAKNTMMTWQAAGKQA